MTEVKEAAERIRSMKVRGAGRIAREAATALKLWAEKFEAVDREEFLAGLREAGEVLVSARPSAVSLPNAVRFVIRGSERFNAKDVEEQRRATIATADAFIERSLRAVKRIGEIGAKRISEGDVILVHCHSTAALSIVKTAWRQGKKIEVVSTESRPFYQGHIASRELAGEGIPVTLIVDSAARSFMKKVDKVVVGADSIASNGALINKIGTSQVALAAHEARVLFLVAAETYKFHPETLVGELVEIEERDIREVADPKDFPGVTIRNPAFDVTPPEYIDLIITEKGVIPPQAAFTVIREEFGWALGEE
jgi:ribose 1,5-bisphosphate isomerase